MLNATMRIRLVEPNGDTEEVVVTREEGEAFLGEADRLRITPGELIEITSRRVYEALDDLPEDQMNEAGLISILDRLALLKPDDELVTYWRGRSAWVVHALP